MPEIDFEALKDKKQDFRYWLYIPALELNYPVVQGADNEAYLYKTFEGEKRTAQAAYLWMPAIRRICRTGIR